MRRLLIGIAVITLAVGCSSTGSVVHDQDMTEEGRPAVSQDNPRLPGKPLAGELRQDSGVRQENVRQKSGVGHDIDDEEDVASLFEQRDYKDFDIPIVFNDAVRYFIQYFTIEKRKVFSNWLRRAKFYVPTIKVILKEKGLPEDLVYLAMIESGFNPSAYSPAKASGPWQFIYETGGRYGLKVNYWVDERRDPQKSTVAAAKYLKDLFNQFGCWYLAAAGYNAGEKRIERAIEKHNTNDFWELVKYNTLPRETREYIPKLIAAAVIAKDPEKFGFGSISYDQPIKFEELLVPAGARLTAIAKAASIDMSDLRAMNPEILRGITPPYETNGYTIKLPYYVDRNKFVGNLELALVNEKKIMDISAYKVRKGDTLAKIAKKYRITLDDMLLVNASAGELKVKPGTVVNIPRLTVQATKSTYSRSAAKAKTPVSYAKSKAEQKIGTDEKEKRELAQSYHVVKKGETLAMISSKYGIDVASIKSVNNLRNDKVYPKMKLKLAAYTERKPKKSFKYHVVKKGETLAMISSKYGIDVASIKSVNNLRNDKVYPKMKLKISAGER